MLCSMAWFTQLLPLMCNGIVPTTSLGKSCSPSRKTHMSNVHMLLFMSGLVNNAFLNAVALLCSVHSSTLTKIMPRRKEMSTNGRQVRQTDSKLRIPRTTTRQAKAHQGKKVNFRSACFISKENADQVRMVRSPSARMTSRRVPNVS